MLKKHVDEFIHDDFGKESYARWVLLHFRLPAVLQLDFGGFMKDHKLFCTHKGKRYRVTGASRLGDVWLAEDFGRDIGYNLRVGVEECSQWSPES